MGTERNETEQTNGRMHLMWMAHAIIQTERNGTYCTTIERANVYYINIIMRIEWMVFWYTKHILHMRAWCVIVAIAYMHIRPITDTHRCTHRHRVPKHRISLKCRALVTNEIEITIASGRTIHQHIDTMPYTRMDAHMRWLCGNGQIHQHNSNNRDCIHCTIRIAFAIFFPRHIRRFRCFCYWLWSVHCSTLKMWSCYAEWGTCWDLKNLWPHSIHYWWSPEWWCWRLRLI